MSDYDLLLRTVDAIYAAGVETDHLTAALDKLNQLLGGAGATFEIVDATKGQHTDFFAVGAPSKVGASYLEQFAAINPHIQFASSQPKGQITWDYQLFDENQMKRHPFYADFLPTADLRYCIGSVLERTPNKLVLLYAQRTSRQGHVEQREIALMQSVCPHFQRAYDMASRLKVADGHRGALENALEWLVDGVALLRADGDIAYANEALCRLARRCDGFFLNGGTIEFISSEAQERFIKVFSTVVSRDPHDLLVDARPTDFAVLRKDGAPAYTVAVRPLVRGQIQLPRYATDAVAMLFVHDPLSRNIAARQMLQQLFGLTEAEAHLGQALCAGMTTGAYASTRRISLNTVYTHLRRLREKTDCKSVADLTRRFNEMNVPLRLK